MTSLHQKLYDKLSAGGEDIAVLGAGRKPDITYTAFAAMVAQIQISMSGHTAVGILSTRRIEAYVAVLGAFLGGVSFVPMNPELPQERLEKIAKAAKIGVVLADPSTISQAKALSLPVINIADEISKSDAPHLRAVPIDEDQIAYQMFTSGSTGEPKGVPICYKSLNHYVSSIVGALSIPMGVRFSQFFDLSFDLSMHDIFVALLQGGTLCPASNIDMMMPHSYIAKKKIDVWFSVPILAAVALRGLESATVAHKMKMVLFCGEPLPTDYAAAFTQFVHPNGHIFNLYGPTEATIAITMARFDPTDTRFSTVPLGGPFGESRIAIETANGIVDPSEVDAEGELLLGGPQVFDGYMPEVDADCFVKNSHGMRFYRSGDLVRQTDGALVHMGRTDSQIKLRGFRIELGDIEAAVRACFEVSAAAAVVLGMGSNKEIGLAYEANEDIEDVTQLADHLPVYMRPVRWLRVKQMPLNINHKIDKKAVRAMKWPA